MNNRIRLGMVGGGLGAFIGPIHRMAARLDGHYELCAGVFSDTPEENLASARQFGIAEDRCYEDFTRLFEQEAQRQDGIEVVAIVTPNHLHFDVAKAAMTHGIAVICEKPMTLTLEEARGLEVLARDTGVPYLLTHTYCGYPMVQEARHRIQRGDLGEIMSFSVEYLQEWLTEAPEDSNRQAAWRLNPKIAGAAGCLGDIGTHAFQLASYMIDEPLTAISAKLGHAIPSRQVDDNVQATLELGDRIRGHLWASQTAPGFENALSVRVVGRKASVEWRQESPNELWFCPLGQPRQKITRRPDFLSEFAASNTRTPGGHPEGYLEAFGNLYQQFAKVLRQEIPEQKELPGVNTGVQALAFIEHAMASDRQGGAWVVVPGEPT